MTSNQQILWADDSTFVRYLSPSGRSFLKRLTAQSPSALLSSGEADGEVGRAWQAICSVAFRIPLSDSVNPGGIGVFSNTGHPRNLTPSPARSTRTTFSHYYIPASAGVSANSYFERAEGD